MDCLSVGLRMPMCLSIVGMGSKAWEGVGVNELHCGSKSYKLKLLGKLIV